MDIQTFVEETQRQLNSIERRLNFVTGGAVTDQLVNLDVIGASTYTNLHQWLNNTCSAMRISGGVISDSGGGQIDVAAGTGILKIADDPLGVNVQFDWSAEFNLALADNETNWIGIEYNAGVPQVKIETDLANFTFHDDFVLGRVYRNGAALSILNAGSYYDNFQHRVCFRIFETEQFRRVLGGIIADEGLLDFSITEGAWYCGTTRFTTAAWDCSGADTFTYWYRDGGGGWTTVGAQADINNLNYDDGVPPLGALGVGRFGVHWVYLAHDGSVHVQYGQGNYRHFEAESALVPAGPDFFVENCILVGKIVVGQADPTFTDVLSAFEVVFIGAAASLHNDLGGLQGGQADQYYHLNAVEHPYVSGANAQSLLTTASPTFIDITANHLALGGAAIDVDIGLHYNEALTDVDNSEKIGIYSELEITKTSAVMTSNAYSIYGSIKLTSSNTQNWTAVVGMQCIQGYVETEFGSTGTIAGTSVFLSRALITDAATVTNLYGLYISTPSVINNKLINEYGIYITNQNTGLTLNYAIYTNAGLVRFGDAVSAVTHITADEMRIDSSTNPDLRFYESGTIKGLAQYGTAANAFLYQTVDTVPALVTRMRIEGEQDETQVSIGPNAGLTDCDLSLLYNGILGLKETTTPAATANYGKFYTKNDNKLYFQDGAGVEHEVAYAP